MGRFFSGQAISATASTPNFVLRLSSANSEARFKIQSHLLSGQLYLGSLLISYKLGDQIRPHMFNRVCHCHLNFVFCRLLVLPSSTFESYFGETSDLFCPAFSNQHCLPHCCRYFVQVKSEFFHNRAMIVGLSPLGRPTFLADVFLDHIVAKPVNCGFSAEVPDMTP